MPPVKARSLRFPLFGAGDTHPCRCSTDWCFCNPSCEALRFWNSFCSAVAQIHNLANNLRIVPQRGRSVDRRGRRFPGSGFVPHDLRGMNPDPPNSEKSSYTRILRARFPGPVSFVFSHKCSLFGRCTETLRIYACATDEERSLKQTCRPQILEDRARDVGAVVIFCPNPPTFLCPPSTAPSIRATTSPISDTDASAWAFECTPPPQRRVLQPRESKTSKLLGAELGGTIGGAAFLLLLVIAFICIRRRRARDFETRLPQRQEPFIVNPTWVLASPTTPEGHHSHLSLPDRARPRTIPVAHQMSMPDLSATQYRARVLRPRASTVGTALVRTQTGGSQDPASPSWSESSVWRPRIDILGARQQRPEGQGPSQPQTFWAEP